MNEIKVLTPVGTSLIENCIKSKHGELRAKYSKLNILPVKEIPDDWQPPKKAGNINSREKIVRWAVNNKNASAEITSVLKIQDKLNKPLEVFLIATETISSILAAEMLKEIFEKSSWPDLIVHFDQNKKSHVIDGLQVANSYRFERDGMPGLVFAIERMTGGHYENVALNITGGYKAIIPYLTIMGQIYNMPTYYTFDEPPHELIEIPQAPINIDWGIFEKYQHVIDELANGVKEDWETFKRKNGLEEDFRACIHYEEENGYSMIFLNAIGAMFWKQYQNLILIDIPSGDNYFREDSARKKELNKAFQSLYKKLGGLETPFETITDDILKHASIDDTFIYKHTGPHIRIQYRLNPDSGRLTIYNYRYKSDSPNYREEMKREYSIKKSSKLTTINFRKER